MTSILFRNIKSLIGLLGAETLRLSGSDMKQLNSIESAWLLIEEGIIRDYGVEPDCPYHRADQQIDCTDRTILPAFVDSHTHLVFAAWREGEFVDRLHGLTYEQIAENGGGILNSAARLQAMSEDELFDSALVRLQELMRLGTAAIEIKSGYGLTTESEIKMLRVIRRLKETNLIPVRATFLGAHAIPQSFKTNRQGYIGKIIGEMLPQIEQEGLADYIDVFCEKGFYTVEETDQILTAGVRHGLQVRVHANEMDYSGGIQIGVKHNAVSVDHLEFTGDAEIQSLLQSDTIATVLPSTAFFLGLPYAPARTMIDRGLCVSLASDYNPGTSPSGNLSFVLSLACIKLKMTPEEALNALTINAAAALQWSDRLGSITRGKSANLILTRPEAGLHFLPYSFAQSWIDRVVIKGHFV